MSALLKRGITNMGEHLDEEYIEDLIRRMANSIDVRSPYEHLHDWLEQANPEVFKQWRAVYDIERKD